MSRSQISQRPVLTAKNQNLTLPLSRISASKIKPQETVVHYSKENPTFGVQSSNASVRDAEISFGDHFEQIPTTFRRDHTQQTERCTGLTNFSTLSKFEQNKLKKRSQTDTLCSSMQKTKDIQSTVYVINKYSREAKKRIEDKQDKFKQIFGFRPVTTTVEQIPKQTFSIPKRILAKLI